MNARARRLTVTTRPRRDERREQQLAAALEVITRQRRELALERSAVAAIQEAMKDAVVNEQRRVADRDDEIAALKQRIQELEGR
jgi:hypothetical protein